MLIDQLPSYLQKQELYSRLRAALQPLEGETEEEYQLRKLRLLALPEFQGVLMFLFQD
jgi:hypothetical protein